MIRSLSAASLLLAFASASWSASVQINNPNDVVWFDDALPAGAVGTGTNGDSWRWVTKGPSPASGVKSHLSNVATGAHQHAFNGASAFSVPAGSSLFTYVYIDPANPPSEIMIGWTKGTTDSEHRAYWGANNLNVGTSGSQSRYYAGALPAPGQWARLEVPASAVGLEGANLQGMTFALYNGRAAFDRAGRTVPSTSGGTGSGGTTTGGTTTGGTTTGGTTTGGTTTGGTTTGGTTTGGTTTGGTTTGGTTTGGTTTGGTTTGGTTTGGTTTGGTTTGTTTTGTTTTGTTTSSVDTLWIDDALPIGAGGMGSTVDTWNWVSSPAPQSGAKAHRSDVASGRHEHWFGWSNNNLGISAGDKLITYVYLDPASPPKQIMLSWSTNTSWNQRAYWGADLLHDGTGTGYYNAGALPATGQWVRLEVPASAVGLEGQVVTAMKFTCYDGGATWDSSGKSGSSTSSGTTSGTSGSTTSTTSTSSGGTGTSTSANDPAIAVSSVSTPATTSTSVAAQGRFPQVGDYELRILNPTTLELRRILQKPAGGAFAEWNFVDANGNFSAPATSQFTVTAGSRTITVGSVGFRRIAAYAPLYVRDLRVEASLFLSLSSPISDGESVTVKSSLLPTTMNFTATATATRINPAIHVNQEGYAPTFKKKAMVGYYLGNKGEMPIDASKGFSVVNTATGASVLTGSLTARKEMGYELSPMPYQNVYEADFSSLTAPGEYQVVVPGMGASLPFLINDGVAMAFTRTYELGIYHQRCGGANTMPYTRFTHGSCHLLQAEVPTTATAYDFTWRTVASKSGGNATQTAPQLVSAATSLYPFVNQGKIDVTLGHHDAGDYSKYTIDVALLAHTMLFTVDAIKGTADLDNLGLPESGDGISDILQEAKWEADFLAKMQDADGGFYFLVYPKNREYEGDVSPEFGDQQVVWPKNTSATAASVAALAEFGSSPLFKKYYPNEAASYLAKAKLGWQFLMNAHAKYGKAGAYQKITHYGDEFNDADELVWAAAALFVATGEQQYSLKLKEWFPNPRDYSTVHWGWDRLYQGYGGAIRDYAFAVRTGRLTATQVDAAYLAACEAEILAAGDDVVTWTKGSAYGTSFPYASRRYMQAGWFFSLGRASDMAAAYQIQAKSDYVDAMVENMNYEAGLNPVNISFVAGLGVKRPHNMVSQYRNTNRHIMPPIGEPQSNLHHAFAWLELYGSELSAMSFPADGSTGTSYPLQDRFSDLWNVTTEFVTLDQARALTGAAFLATQTAAKSTPWKPTATLKIAANTAPKAGQPLTLSVDAAGLDLAGARVFWETQDQLPSLGSSYTITPASAGTKWAEVEITWPDGRRLFGTGSYTVQ